MAMSFPCVAERRKGDGALLDRESPSSSSRRMRCFGVLRDLALALADSVKAM